MLNINILDFNEWKEKYNYHIPFEEWSSSSKYYFSEWQLKHLSTDIDKVTSIYTSAKPIDVRRIKNFCESILKYIDDNNTKYMNMYEYEQYIHVEAVSSEPSNNINDFLLDEYDKYVTERIRLSKSYIKMNADDKYNAIFDINTGKVIETRGN